MDDKPDLFKASPRKSTTYGDGSNEEKTHSQTQLDAKLAARATYQIGPCHSQPNARPLAA